MSHSLNNNNKRRSNVDGQVIEQENITTGSRDEAVQHPQHHQPQSHPPSSAGAAQAPSPSRSKKYQKKQPPSVNANNDSNISQSTLGSSSTADDHHHHQQHEDADDDDFDDDTVTGDWSIADTDTSQLCLEEDDDDESGSRKPAGVISAPPLSSSKTTNRRDVPASVGVGRSNSNNNSFIMSAADIAIFQRLDLEFDRALEDREIAYSARFYSVRQAAFFSVVFMAIYLTLGTIFFKKQADWSVGDSILFSIYTITTVGYGHLEHPETVAFQVYTIFFIFIGIATMTIVVAQVYQWFALEASRAQHSRDQSELARRGGGVEILSRSQVAPPAAAADQQKQSEDGSSADGDHPSRAAPSRVSSSDSIILDIPQHSPVVEFLWRAFDRSRSFFTTHEIGRGLSVLFPFIGLIAIGAIVIGPIERWSVVESLYFSVVSLTTVGFGDYYPTRSTSIWFCILWLPFSVGFMSLFLANVAAFYIRLSDKNIERIEGQLRRDLAKSKERAEEERQAARKRALRGQQLRRSIGRNNNNRDDDHDEQYNIELRETKQKESALATATAGDGLGTDEKTSRPDGFDTIPSSEDDDDVDNDVTFSSRTNSKGRPLSSGHSRRSLFGSKRSPRNRRKLIEINYNQAATISPVNSERNLMRTNDGGKQQQQARPRESTMATMRDCLRAVRMNMAHEGELSETSSFPSAGPESVFLSIRSSQTVRKALESDSVRKPSFALRALVQERFSEIIATDIAGYSNNIEISENTLSITIDSLKQTADKWLVPRRARRAFRAVSFEAILFVGEHGLVTRGADALYDLTPFEFHRLFAPLLAAMGDAETMEGWLSSTQVLAEVDLGRDSRKWAAEEGQPALEAMRLDIERGGKVSTRTRVTPGSAFAAANNSVQYG